MICVHVYKCEENGVANEAIVLQLLVQSASWDFKVVKTRWIGALLSVKCCRFGRLATFWFGTFTMLFR